MQIEVEKSTIEETTVKGRNGDVTFFAQPCRLIDGRTDIAIDLPRKSATDVLEQGVYDVDISRAVENANGRAAINFRRVELARSTKAK